MQKITLAKHLVMIGICGVGKSCISKHISDKCGASLFSMDDEVRKSGLENLMTNGFKTMYELQNDFLKRALANSVPSIIDCSGGAVLQPAIYKQLKESDTNRCFLSAPSLLVRSRPKDVKQGPMYTANTSTEGDKKNVRELSVSNKEKLIELEETLKDPIGPKLFFYQKLEQVLEYMILPDECYQRVKKSLNDCIEPYKEVATFGIENDKNISVEQIASNILAKL